MNAIWVNYPVPPIDAVVPSDVQIYSIVFSVSVLILSLVWAAAVSRKYQTALPFWLQLAGFCAVPLEAVVCNLGHAWHAAVGQIPLYVSVDRSLPIHESSSSLPELWMLTSTQ